MTACLYLLCFVCAVLLSCVQLSVTIWTVACQAPLSMGFSSEEYWSGLLFAPPRDLPDPGIELASDMSPAMQADSSPTELWGLNLKKRAS